MEIKNINSREFTSILLKGKTIKFQDFRFLAICYFRKDVMEKFLKDILQSKETINYNYENCQLSPQIDQDFYDKFYKKAKKNGCKKCDIFLVTDTPNGTAEKLRGEFVIFTKDRFFVINKECIKLEKYEEPYIKYYIDYRYLKD